jgi:hypothetical protein
MPTKVHENSVSHTVEETARDNLVTQLDRSGLHLLQERSGLLRGAEADRRAVAARLHRVPVEVLGELVLVDLVAQGARLGLGGHTHAGDFDQHIGHADAEKREGGRERERGRKEKEMSETT